MNKNKNTFASLSNDMPPSKLVKDALPFVKEKGLVLDIGAGSLRNSKFLVGSGFKKVIALDRNLIEVQHKGIEFIQTNIENYDFPENEADLVLSINVLSFLSQEQFDIVFPKIVNLIKKGGILCATLFGINDGWSSNEEMNFHTKESVLELIKDFNIKIFIEEESEGKTIQGTPKHWHIFRFVVEK